jgi:hypothetical protein
VEDSNSAFKGSSTVSASRTRDTTWVAIRE